MTLHEFLNLPINPTAFNIITFILNLAVSFTLLGAVGYAVYWKLTGEEPPLFGPISFKNRKSKGDIDSQK